MEIEKWKSKDGNQKLETKSWKLKVEIQKMELKTQKLKDEKDKRNQVCWMTNEPVPVCYGTEYFSSDNNQ